MVCCGERSWEVEGTLLPSWFYPVLLKSVTSSEKEPIRDVGGRVCLTPHLWFQSLRKLRSVAVRHQFYTRPPRPCSGSECRSFGHISFFILIPLTTESQTPCSQTLIDSFIIIRAIKSSVHCHWALITSSLQESFSSALCSADWKTRDRNNSQRIKRAPVFVEIEKNVHLRLEFELNPWTVCVSAANCSSHTETLSYSA